MTAFIVFEIRSAIAFSEIRSATAKNDGRENRSGTYFWRREHRQRRNRGFAARQSGFMLSYQPLGPPRNAVTARRFCDQQEMSSQVATGFSLP